MLIEWIHSSISALSSRDLSPGMVCTYMIIDKIQWKDVKKKKKTFKLSNEADYVTQLREPSCLLNGT